MELPKHIADMCGIKTAPKTKILLQSANEFEAITKDVDENGVIQIAYREKTIGWIAEFKEDNADRFRALTAGGKITRCYSYTHAFNTLFEEYC